MIEGTIDDRCNGHIFIFWPITASYTLGGLVDLHTP